MPSDRIHQLIERLSVLFRADLRQVAHAHGLKLIQLEALIYLSTANRYSDTPAAVTEYLGITKGTVSQTLKALARHGLVEKRADPGDGRVVHCQVTPAGRRVAEAAYPSPLLAALDPAARADAEGALESLLRGLQRAHGAQSFGVCRTCRFYQRGEAGGVCGLTREPLSDPDSDRLCREHQPPTSAAGS